MPDKPKTDRPNVRIVTLGCAKNDVDSEEIAGVLAESGYRVDGSADTADVVVINTCGFLQAAREEGIQAIKQAVKDKRSGKVKRIVVAGCLAQRMGEDLAKIAPGADAYVGVGQMGRFGEIIQGIDDCRLTIDDLSCRKSQIANRKSGLPLLDISPPHHRWANVATRARTGNPWSAYLKVSEGCDHKCTFCTIPSFRGPHVSKPIERLIAEARHLASTGAKEINLIAQDVTQYGYDLYKEFTLPRLLRELNGVDGIEWIRILYFYPNRLTDEVIEAMATLPKVLPYIDIPLQHAHPETLRRMKRPWDGERYLRLFEKLRAAMPECAIRTTFIVGFPGETDAEFTYLLDFMRQARLDRVGAFLYSREPGTPSYDMDGQVPFRIKQGRYARLMQLQQGISRQVNESWIGKRMKVLVEGEVGEVAEVGEVGSSKLAVGSSQFAGPDPIPPTADCQLLTPFSTNPNPAIQNPKSKIQNPAPNPQSAIRNPQSDSANPQSAIRNPKSGPHSAIRNPKSEILLARSHRDAPEIDGWVYVHSPNPQPSPFNPRPSTPNPRPATCDPRPATSNPSPGAFLEVEITGAAEYDLWAQVV